MMLYYQSKKSMNRFEYKPIVPLQRDCIVCLESANGKEYFYSVQESDISKILAKYKANFKAIFGEEATKYALYYVDSIGTTQLFGINET